MLKNSLSIHCFECRFLIRSWFGMPLMFCFFLLSNIDCNASIAATIRNTDSLVTLGKYMLFFEDTSDVLTIHDIRSSKWAHSFKEHKSNVPNFTTRHPVWAEFEIINDGADQPLLQIVNGGLDSLELFFFDSTGNQIMSFERKTIGLANQQAYKLPAFVFKVPPIKRLKVYLRMHSTATLAFKVHMGTEKAIYDANIVRVGLHCLYFGIVMIMVLYNFFIFVSTRDWAYLFYIIFGFLFAAHVAHLQGFDIFLPAGVADLQQEYFRAIAMMCTGFGGVFAIIFLQVKTYLPKAYYLYIVCIAASFINLFYSLTGHNLLLSYLIMRLCSSVPLIIYLLTSLMIYRNGYQPAMFFFVAFLGFEICLILNILVQAGVIPNFSIVTEYVMHFGSAFELLTLSFALAYRINLLKKEKVEIQKENFRLVSEQKELLEQKVSERTNEIKTQKEELALANERLLELDKFKDGIMNVVAHDLRAPLTRVKGLADLLMADTSLSENQRNYSNLVLKSADSGLHFIRNFLLVNNADMDSFSVNFGQLELHEFVKYQVLIHEVQVRTKNIHVKILEFSSPVLVHTDEIHLGRIFENLFTNAIKFSNPNTEVQIGIREELNYNELYIKDQGPGFSEEDRSKMFNKFQKLSAIPTGGEESTGLGLAIVKALAEKLNIALTLESEEGLGSVFYLRFEKPVQNWV